VAAARGQRAAENRFDFVQRLGAQSKRPERARMAEFNAAQVLDEAKEREEQIAAGGKLVPVLAAIIAVFAALATLFANHSSVTGLATKNEAILSMNKATDQFNYYESKRIKVQLNQAFISSGIVKNGDGLKNLQSAMAKEDAQAKDILKSAQNLQRESDDHYERSERFMQSYEKYEVAATLFEVSIVLVSITALMQTKALLWVAGGATLIGIIFFITGSLLH
jgi:hypothetical protein